MLRRAENKEIEPPLASIVLKSSDWAVRQKEEGRFVILGFYSMIEKDIFGYLIKGTQPVIMALTRGLREMNL